MYEDFFVSCNEEEIGLSYETYHSEFPAECAEFLGMACIYTEIYTFYDISTKQIELRRNGPTPDEPYYFFVVKGTKEQCRTWRSMIWHKGQKDRSIK